MEPFTPTPAAPVPPPPAAPPPRQSSSTSRPLKIALASGAVASVVSAILIWGTPNTSLFTGSELLLTPAGQPLFAAAMLDTGAQTITELTVEGQGTASIIGYAKGADENYYLMSEEEGTRSNIYVKDTKNPEMGLSQRTTSDTLKVGLSADPATGLLAYTVLTGTSTSGTITISRPGTTTEEVLVEGSNPTVLAGGSFLAYESDGALYSYHIADRKEYKLLDIPANGSYAIDGKELTVAIYNPSVSEIQTYSLVNFASASAQSSRPVRNNGRTPILALSGNSVTQLFAGEEGLFIPAGGKGNTLKLIPGSTSYTETDITGYEN